MIYLSYAISIVSIHTALFVLLQQRCSEASIVFSVLDGSPACVSDVGSCSLTVHGGVLDENNNYLQVDNRDRKFCVHFFVLKK